VESVEQWRAGRSASLGKEYLKGKSKGKRGEGKTEEEDRKKEFRIQNECARVLFCLLPSVF
jgi:hypothetical protein